MRRRGGAAIRRLLPALSVAAVAAGLLAAAPGASAATGGRAQSQAAPATAASAKAHDPVAVAAQQARRTGKPVSVPGLTTPTSVTSALPDGQLKMTTSSVPVRARTKSGWQDLDATLQRGAGGTWSPRVASSPVTISGGGTGPLATISNAGRSMSLTWPGALPAPVVSGSTATYRSVLPGVDLQLTVSASGGVRDVLVIHDKAAAANPALRTLSIGTETSGGLQVTSGKAGTLQAAAPHGGAPVFTAPVPEMWDSATTAPGTLPARKAAAKAGLAVPDLAAPAASGSGQPGRGAHAAWVETSLGAPQKLRGGIIRQAVSLIPDAALLTGSSTVYPVYVDPSWWSSPGTKGWYASDADAYLSANNYYDNTADPSTGGAYLQVGYNGSFNAHAFVDMKVNSGQMSGATIHSASISFTEETAWSCAPEPVQLWNVGSPPTSGGKPVVSWDDEPTWYTQLASKTVAYGHSPDCPDAAAVNFDITSYMKSVEPKNPNNLAFGLRVPDLNTTSEWKEFSNAAGAITMTTYYDHAPNPQAYSKVSPGGACQTASAAGTIVGNDDLALTTTSSDPDGGGFTTYFVISAAGSTTPLATLSKAGLPNNEPVSVGISSTQIQGWHSDGATTAYAYSWYSYTDDGLLNNEGDTGTGTKAHPCLFTYDPTAPQSPYISPPPLNSDGSVGTIGSTVSFTFANCKTLLYTPPVACKGTAPAQYEYQVDDGTEHTVSVSGTSQQVSIPLTRVDDNFISVVSLSAGGNPSAAFPLDFSVDKPATAYPDGDYAGTGNPDLISVGDGTGSADKPGLWLAESDGAGHLSTPIDIGARGTGRSTDGSPADWNGAQVLHGDFSGDGVQDIGAYYPPPSSGDCTTSSPATCGTLQVIYGPGTAASLDPESGNVQSLPPGALDDSFLDSSPGSTDNPVDLVAAGNASYQNAALPDLMGILCDPGNGSGDPGNGCELNIYYATAGVLNFSSAYGNIDTVAAPRSDGPDGALWGPAWSLAVAEAGGQAVLFALDSATGQLWESTNPNASASTLIGSSGSTWTRITGGPWSAGSGPALAQADVNAAGHIELWTTSGGTATAWILPSPSATALSQEVINNSRPLLGHAWPLSDGPAEQANGSSTLDDTETTGTSGNATASSVCFTGSSACPDTDPVLGPVADFTGSGGSIALPAGVLQDTTTAHAALQSMTLTMKFRAAPGSMGILAGTSTGSLSSPVASSAPIMYIGTDGRLYAQFPSGHPNSTGQIGEDITPMISPAPVDDGLWHTVTLVADGTSHDQVLYLDNDIPIHLDDNGWIDTANTKALGATYNPPQVINPGQKATGGTYSADQVTIGAGVFSPDGWLNADATNGAEGTTRASSFAGGTPDSADISDVALYPEALTMAQLPENAPQPVTTDVNSGVSPGYCIDNNGGTAANANKVQIWQCNGHSTQNWTFEPDGTIHWAGNTGYCLAVSNGTTSGTPVYLWSCNNQGGQQWQVLSTGEIMNPQSGMCLDDTGSSTTNGTQLQIYLCSGRASGTWSTLVRPAETAPVGTIVGNATGHCASNAGGSPTSIGGTADGNHIEADACAGLPSQQWTFNPNGTITVGGHCIDNTGSAATNGNTIQLHACDGTGAQVWAHPDNGTFYNPAAKMCIEDSNGNTSVQLVLETCTYNANQTWAYPDTYNR